MVGYEEMIRAMHVHKGRSLEALLRGKIWARVRRGCYRGDLARVMAVNPRRSIVRAWMVPRIDYGILSEQVSELRMLRWRDLERIFPRTELFKDRWPRNDRVLLHSC